MADEGRLLQFSVDVLYNELLKQMVTEDLHPCKDDIDAAVEQCFYCMYGHPNKRAKAKHLEDHTANPVMPYKSYSSLQITEAYGSVKEAFYGNQTHSFLFEKLVDFRKIVGWSVITDIEQQEKTIACSCFGTL